MGLWVLTRYDDVVMVLRDPRFGRDGFEQVLAIDDSSTSVAIGASGDEANRCAFLYGSVAMLASPARCRA
jgi:hypothetical protein